MKEQEEKIIAVAIFILPAIAMWIADQIAKRRKQNNAIKHKVIDARIKELDIAEKELQLRIMELKDKKP